MTGGRIVIGLVSYWYRMLLMIDSVFAALKRIKDKLVKFIVRLTLSMLMLLLCVC